jgi:hypothetical protein
MSLPKQLETGLDQVAVANQEFYADPIAMSGHAGIRLSPDRVDAVRGLQVKTNLKAGAVDAFIWFDHG